MLTFELWLIMNSSKSSPDVFAKHFAGFSSKCKLDYISKKIIYKSSLIKILF